MKKSILLFFSLLITFCSYSKTIAISYFDNSSGDAKYNALSKGIADMLITDLSKVKGITIVEREKLEKLLQEIKLGQTKYFDQTTAQKLGKGLGAQNILTGSFYLLDNTIRIDARLIDVQTGGIIIAEQVSGNKNNFFALHQQLANLLAKNLNVPYSPNLSGFYKPNEEVSVLAVVNYSNAIEMQDIGMNADATILLEKTVKANPKFRFAKNKLEDIKEWLKKIEDEREKLIAEELKNTINNLDPLAENFGAQLSNVWSTLLTSYKYNQLLSFNNSLRKMNLDDKKKLYGEASTISLGEMLLYYDCTALMTLKKYDELIDASKKFITNFPTSMYFQSVKINLEQAIKELELRENGKNDIELKLDASSLDAYVNYLNKLKWKSNLQFVNEKEYKKYLSLYKSQVLSVSKKTIEIWDESTKFSEFSEFYEVAEYFNDIKEMEQIVSYCKQLFDDEENQDKVFRLENRLEDYKSQQVKRTEKLNALENISKTGTNEELAKIIKSSYSIEKLNRPDLIISICNRYVKEFKFSNKNEADICIKAWDILISNSAKSISIEEARKQFELLKKKSDDFKEHQIAFDKLIRDLGQDLKNIQNDFNNYEKNFVNNDPMIAVLENYAKIYNETHQYVDEAYTRKQLLELYKLNDDEESLQLFMLSMSYYNLGYFENVRKTAALLSKKYPESSYAESISSIIKFMPQ